MALRTAARGDDAIDRMVQSFSHQGSGLSGGMSACQAVEGEDDRVSATYCAILQRVHRAHPLEQISALANLCRSGWQTSQRLTNAMRELAGPELPPVSSLPTLRVQRVVAHRSPVSNGSAGHRELPSQASTSPNGSANSNQSLDSKRVDHNRQLWNSVPL